jgi:hypothetical protein
MASGAVGSIDGNAPGHRRSFGWYRIQGDPKVGGKRIREPFDSCFHRVSLTDFIHKPDELTDLEQSPLPNPDGDLRRGSAGLLQEERRLVDLCLRDDSPGINPQEVLLGSQLHRCGEPANDGNGIRCCDLLLEWSSESGCNQEGDTTNENHYQSV